MSLLFAKGRRPSADKIACLLEASEIAGAAAHVSYRPPDDSEKLLELLVSGLTFDLVGLPPAAPPPLPPRTHLFGLTAQDIGDGIEAITLLPGHHLLPRQIVTSKPGRSMVEGLDRQRLGFDDFRINGVLLPAHEERALANSLPLHCRSHRHYNAVVIERLGQIERDWSARRGIHAHPAGEDALMRLALLQSALRLRPPLPRPSPSCWPRSRR